MICLLLWVSIIISLLLRMFIMICLLKVLIMICLLLRVLIMISLIKGVNHDLFVIKGEEEGEYDEDADPDYVPQVGILQNTVTKICNLKLQGFF